MEHFCDGIGENWFTYKRLYAEMVAEFGDGSRFVEIGSWKGRSAAFMGVEILNSGKNIKFDCVDHWRGSEENLRDSGLGYDPRLHTSDWLYTEFLRNTAPVSDRIRTLRMDSTNAAQLYEDGSLDFVFVDAAHDYESVKRDVAAWLPKVKPGGCIAGHDYSAPGVSAAVNEVIGDVVSLTDQDCWMHRVVRNRIVDGFIFYNEFDMLDLRLDMLDGVVDHHILVEATYTHRGEPKPLYFQENRDRFSKYLHKIVHIVVDEVPTEIVDKFSWEVRHRNGIAEGFKYLSMRDDDLLIVADCDEIPDPDTLETLRNSKFSALALEMDLYYYNIECRNQDKWYHPKVIKFRDVKYVGTPENIRFYLGEGHVPKGGWHLSYFGDEEFISNKIGSISHIENDVPEINDFSNIKKSIDTNSWLVDGSPFQKVTLEHNEYLHPKLLSRRWLRPSVRR